MDWITIKETILHEVDQLQNDLQHRENLLLEKRKYIDYLKESIFTINHQAIPIDDGDEDILDINFAGEVIQVKRSVLTKPYFGWNFFSCLFEKRWDSYHVRDKEGRMYVDLKYEWLKPFLEKLINPDGGLTFPNSHYTTRSMDLLELNSIFELKTTETELQISGLENSEIYHSSFREFQIIQHMLFKIYNEPHHTSFKHIHTFDFHHTESLKEDVPDYDLRYRILFYLIETTDLTRFGVIVDSAQITPSNTKNSESVLVFSLASVTDFLWLSSFRYLKDEDEITSLKELFPITWVKNIRFNKEETIPEETFCDIYIPITGKANMIEFDPEDANSYYATNEDISKIEVYEMVRNYRHELAPRGEVLLGATGPAAPVAAPATVATDEIPISSEAPVTSNPRIESIVKILQEKILSYEKEEKELDLHQERLLQEIEFLSKYFYLAWLPNFPVDSKEEAEEEVDPFVLLREVAAGIASPVIPMPPIVSFNIDGKILSILRSTILRVIPYSQIAIKVSGRWIGQSGEVDDEGNYYLSFPSMMLEEEPQQEQQDNDNDCDNDLVAAKESEDVEEDGEDGMATSSQYEVFNQIFSSIQLNYFDGFSNVLYITENTKDSNMMEILDYYQIDHFDYFYLVNWDSASSSSSSPSMKHPTSQHSL